MSANMMTKGGMLVLAAGLVAAAQPAHAATILLNGFENSLNGYTTTGGNSTLTPSGFSTTTGVSQGTYSATVTSAGGSPNYGQFLQSGFSTANTAALNGATSLSFDVTTVAGTFGGFLQFKVQLQQNDAPLYTLEDLGGYDGAHSAVLGSTTTMTFAIPAAVQAQLAAAALGGSGTTIYIGVGGGVATAGTTFQLDNLLVTTPAPEPASLGLVGMAGMALAGRRRKA